MLEKYEDTSVPVKIISSRQIENGNEVLDTNIVTVGEMIQHIAVSNLPIITVSWAISNPTCCVANYQCNVQTGAVTNLPAFLPMNPLIFAWFNASQPEATVTATVETTEGVFTVTQTFIITSPSIAAMISQTGLPAVISDNQNNAFLRLVLSATPLEYPGINIEATVIGNQATAGQLAFFQLAINARFCTSDENQNFQFNTNNIAILDIGQTNTYIYQNITWPIVTGQTVQVDISDSPAQQLSPSGMRSFFIGDDAIQTESYQAYLMFIPNTTGSIWVPLGLLRWYWAGYTNFENGQWSPVVEPQCSPNPSGLRATFYPTWTLNTSQSQFVPSTLKIKNSNQQFYPIKPEFLANTPPPKKVATYAISSVIVGINSGWWTVDQPDQYGNLPLIAAGFGPAQFTIWSVDPSNPNLIKIQGPNNLYVDIRGGFGMGQLYCDCQNIEEADTFIFQTDQFGYSILIGGTDPTYAANLYDPSTLLILYLPDAQSTDPGVQQMLFLTLKDMSDL